MIFERLKERRNYEGYTQANIANILNVQRATYAGWESGKDIMPLRQLYKIANNYQVSLDYLTGLSENEQKVIGKSKTINIENVANHLKEFRTSKHLTQADIAKALQTTQSNIHKYETGKCLITTMYAIEFSKHYNYSLDKLLDREEIKK